MALFPRAAKTTDTPTPPVTEAASDGPLFRRGPTRAQLLDPTSWWALRLAHPTLDPGTLSIVGFTLDEHFAAYVDLAADFDVVELSRRRYHGGGEVHRDSSLYQMRARHREILVLQGQPHLARLKDADLPPLPDIRLDDFWVHRDLEIMASQLARTRKQEVHSRREIRARFQCHACKSPTEVAEQVNIHGLQGPHALLVLCVPCRFLVEEELRREWAAERIGERTRAEHVTAFLAATPRIPTRVLPWASPEQEQAAG